MKDTPTRAALRRAARRAGVHLVQALIEGLKAVEAVIDEIAGISEGGHNGSRRDSSEVIRERIDVE